MTTERYVVLGLARARSSWFSDITRWSTSAAIPVEFVKCLTPDEARARLTTGRRWSAVLLDAAAPGLDRDLLELVAAVGSVPIVVADPRVERDWRELGAVEVLPPELEQTHLVRALAEHTRPISRRDPLPDAEGTTPPSPWRGELVAVTGPGGTGVSTVAALLAHGVGIDVRNRGLVVLADLALDADQAVIHDTRALSPGLLELVDAHRLGRPGVDAVRATTFDGGRQRPYDLLVGLRRHRDWTALRPRAVAAALDGLRSSYRMVVADVDPDIEGEAETGSPDVEDRNVLSRATLTTADAVVVVGRRDIVGIHRLVGLTRSLRRVGIPGDRLVTVINRAPRGPGSKAEITRALADLTADAVEQTPSPVFLPELRRLDDVVGAGAPWPTRAARLVHESVRAVLDRPQPVTEEQPFERVAPGALGSYSGSGSDAS